VLELLETLAGVVVLFAYLAVAVVLPSGVIVAFVLLIGTLLRTVTDPLVRLIPEEARRSRLLARVFSGLRTAVLRVVGLLLFLAMVGASVGGPSPDMIQVGFAQTIVTLTAIQDIVATFLSGRVLNDMLIELQPAPGESPVVSLKLLENLVANRTYTSLKPAVTLLAFRWTFAAFATGVVAIYLVYEPARAVRRRIAQIISPRDVTLSEESLERQAELIAQALARSAPTAAAPAAPAPAAAVRFAPPGTARAPVDLLAQPAPGAISSTQRVAVVTWDEELATEMERQLDSAGFAPIVLRSVAEAFASRVWPAIVFLDARHLQWLSPDRLPLLVRARLVAVTRSDTRVPRGWQLDTHRIEAGTEALLDLLRRRDARRKRVTEENA
jgi:hypothetical protein